MRLFRCGKRLWAGNASKGGEGLLGHEKTSLYILKHLAKARKTEVSKRKVEWTRGIVRTSARHEGQKFERGRSSIYIVGRARKLDSAYVKTLRE